MTALPPRTHVRRGMGDDGGHWAPEPLLYGPGDRLELMSVDATLDMAALYDGVLGGGEG